VAQLIEVKVPDIGDFDGVEVIEVIQKGKWNYLIS